MELGIALHPKGVDVRPKGIVDDNHCVSSLLLFPWEIIDFKKFVLDINPIVKEEAEEDGSDAEVHLLVE